MTKRMLIMIGAVIVLIAALAGGKYLQIKKMIAAIPKPHPETVSTIVAQKLPWQPQLKAVGTLSPVRGVDLASEVAGLVRALVESRATWTDSEGTVRKIGYDDVLVVAPYNAQVGQIASLLPPEARIGTVDKFQGQQAPVSIYSMTTSTPEDAPRGMSFLYSRNRLNVATSRARCMSIVVATPALLRVRVRTPEQMRLANALCLFVELASQQSPNRGG